MTSGVHAIDRALERYGVALTPEDLERLNADCAQGRAILLANNPDGTRKMLVRHGMTALVAVYRPLTGSIVTFLPKHDPCNLKGRKHSNIKRFGRRPIAEPEAAE